MTADPKTRLLSLVRAARRRSNRFVLAASLADAFLPALGLLLAWRVVALLTAVPAGPLSLVLPIAGGLAGGFVLHLRRRLDSSGAALLLDRRAETRERCVTGIRTGGAVAEDALRRLDRATVRRVLTFRPPRTALADLLLAAAVVAVLLLPSLGDPRERPEETVVVLPGSAGGGGGDAGATDAAEAPPSPEEVKRLVRTAEAQVPEGPAAEDLREARQALDAGDAEEARRRIERALERIAAGAGDEEGAASRRIRQTLDAAARATASAAGDGPVDRVDWGADGPLVRRYLRLLDRPWRAVGHRTLTRPRR